MIGRKKSVCLQGCSSSDEGGSYVNTRQIMGELGIDDYSFSDMLVLREVCMVVSRRSANIAAAGT